MQTRTVSVFPAQPRSLRRAALLLAAVAGIGATGSRALADAATPAADADGTPALVSGEPLRVGGSHGLGPLSIGLSSYPLGLAHVTGGERPDLFALAGRFSHPVGLFLLPWRGETQGGVPIFGQPIAVPMEGIGGIPEGPVTIVEQGGQVYLLVLEDRREVKVLRLEPSGPRFLSHARISLPNLPRQPTSIGVLPNPDGSVELVMAIADGTVYRPRTPDWRDPSYVPFDGTGKWTGGYPYLAFYAVHCPGGLAHGRAQDFRRISTTEREILLRGGAVAPLASAGGRTRDLIAGTWWGDLLYYRNSAEQGIDLAARLPVRDADGRVVRHPSCGGNLITWPRADGSGDDLIRGGEGAIYFYRATGGLDADGAPTFNPPVPVLQTDAQLYAGSLPVPNLVDWDGDGRPDLVVGNSEGRLLMFRNLGPAEAPVFAPGVALAAGGEEILVQPGARGSLQGPAEARWGYLSPTVVDWNGDGQLDVVASSATGRHVLWAGLGERPPSRLRAEQTLLVDGLEVRGTWRCRPAAGLLAGRMAYIALNDDDRLHLYWRLDDRHMADGGELKLSDGSPISANFLSAGGTGRTKILLADWDGDGVKDLVLGTPRHGSVPEPTRGLPQALGLPGAAVLVLRNVGTEDQPVFDSPALVTHGNRPLYFGQHECAPTMGEFGGERVLIVGQEDGRLIVYRHSELGLFKPNFNL